jgi:hypothetical protein
LLAIATKDTVNEVQRRWNFDFLDYTKATRDIIELPPLPSLAKEPEPLHPVLLVEKGITITRPKKKVLVGVPYGGASNTKILAFLL